MYFNYIYIWKCTEKGLKTHLKKKSGFIWGREYERVGFFKKNCALFVLLNGYKMLIYDKEMGAFPADSCNFFSMKQHKI